MAFSLGFVDVVWSTTCDAAASDDHSCRVPDLVRDFLEEYGEVPEVTPTDDDEWALTCDPTHSLCRDWVIKVGYENTNYIALPRTAHYEGHDF